MKIKNISNIAIIRDDRLGDTILTLPVVKKLKKDFPNSRITMIISGISKNLLQMFNFIDDIIIIENSIKTIKKINSKNFDLIFNFSPLKGKSYKFFLKAKRKVNVIYSSRYRKSFSNYKYRRFLLNFFFNSNYLYKRDDIKNLTHHTIFMDKILNYEGLSISKKPEKINLKLKNKLKYDCLIHLSNRWVNNEYFYNDFVSLIEKISKKTKNISFSTDLTISGDIKRIIKILKSNKNYNFFLKPSFKKWINLLDQSKFIITPECGCSHVCGILNKKAVVIYDRNNKSNFIKKEYHPYLAKKIIQINSDFGPKLNNKILSYF